MRITAVLDSYNYAQYLPEAIESVLTQSHLPDELILIDDGSSDGSVEVAKKLLNHVPWARIIEKENGGQLSALTRGTVEAKGDLIAFIDCDDAWMPNHLQRACEEFTKHEQLSLYFSSYEEILGKKIVSHYGYQSGLLGPSGVATACGQSYFGSVCSTLVAKAAVLKPYLPLPPDLEADWRINADNIIVWLTSLSGGSKFNDPTPTLRYRNHEENNTNKSHNRRARAMKRKAAEGLFKHWKKSFHWPDKIAHQLPEELAKHPTPITSALRKEYRKALKKQSSTLGLLERKKMAWKL